MQTDALIANLAGHSDDPGYRPTPDDELRALFEGIRGIDVLVARIAARPASPTRALLTAITIEQAKHAIAVAQLKVAQLARKTLVHELPADTLTELRAIAEDPSAFLAGDTQLPEDPRTVPTGRLQFKTPADCLAGMAGIDYFEVLNRMQAGDDLLPGVDEHGMPHGPRYPQLAEQLAKGKSAPGAVAAAARKLEKLRPAIEARPDAAQFADLLESRVAESLAEGDAKNTTKLFDKISDELDEADSTPTAKEIRNKTGIFVSRRTRHYTYFTACMLNADAEVFISHFAESDNARTLAGNRQAIAAAATVPGRTSSTGPSTPQASTAEDGDAGTADDAKTSTDTAANDTLAEADGTSPAGIGAPPTPETPEPNTEPAPGSTLVPATGPDPTQDSLFPPPDPADGPDWFNHPPDAETFDDPPPLETGTVAEDPTPAQRHLQTLLNLMRTPKTSANGATGLPTAKLFVYITLEVLLGLARGAGWSAHGLEISVTEVRQRLAEFGFIPIVLGGDGQILDYGRERRYPPESMKQAIRARDRGCIKPNCTIPPEHCEFHHIKPWSAGGTTSVWNLGMFCPSEHRGADKGDFEVVMKNGVPWVKLAPFEDPEQLPRRNKHWQGEQPPLF
ncbi:HNH endonuclease signature motif containing protein [Paeniglutamicibacter sp.]|uniref:HNH endonuclease signature motif containing protein n=1 Tax=Paeniglutamicibacter sp. TaxID=1934391 RepID=UPI00398939C6